MHCVGIFAKTHHYVVRLDIAMDVVELVHILDSVQQLVEQHQGCLESELATT